MLGRKGTGRVYSRTRRARLEGRVVRALPARECAPRQDTPVASPSSNSLLDGAGPGCRGPVADHRVRLGRLEARVKGEIRLGMTMIKKSTDRGTETEYPPFCTGCHPSRDYSRLPRQLLALRNCTHQRLPARPRHRGPPWGLTPSFHPSPSRAGLFSVALGLATAFRSSRPALLFRRVGLLQSIARLERSGEVPLAPRGRQRHLGPSHRSEVHRQPLTRHRLARRRVDSGVPKARFELARA
jgi:hypothetical protein